MKFSLTQKFDCSVTCIFSLGQKCEIRRLDKKGRIMFGEMTILRELLLRNFFPLLSIEGVTIFGTKEMRFKRVTILRELFQENCGDEKRNKFH